KFTTFFMATLALILALSSCKKVVGNGPTITESRNVSAFNKIKLEIAADLEFNQNPSTNMSSSAQENILTVIRTRVVDGEMIIDLEPGTILGRHDDIKLNIDASGVYSFLLSGSGKVEINDDIAENSVILKVSGSGDILVDGVHCQDLHTEISGSGKIEIANGTVDEHHVKISGSGDVKTENVESRVVNTTTSGSGDTKVFATETLNVKISGSGNVYYRGTPAISASISGSG